MAKRNPGLVPAPVALAIASVLVASAPAHGGQASDAPSGPKWSSYGSLLVQPGSEGVLGGADLFAPLWQNPVGMLFADARGTVDDELEAQGSFGLGIRRQFAGAAIVGMNGYFDLMESQHENTFLQGSGGMEVLTERFDFRVNGYLPSEKKKRVGSKSEIALVNAPGGGQAIRMRVGEERAYYGADWEAGFGVPLPLPGNGSELRFFAGGYWRDAVGRRALLGPQGRVEMRLFDIPCLPRGSRFTIGSEIQWDDPRGLEGNAIARIRIPLNFFAAGREALRGLDRRMVDRPVRTGIITRTHLGDPKQALGPKGHPLGNLAYTDGNTQGDALSVPTAGEIETAIAAAGPGGIIVALDQTGPIDPVNGNQTIELLPGQILIGGGSSFQVTSGGAAALFTAPGGRGLFQTADEIVHLRLMDWSQAIGFDLDGGHLGIDVFGERVIVRDVNISGIASTAAIIEDTGGVRWFGADGHFSASTIGNVSSVDDVNTYGVSWGGDRGRLHDVTIGNVSSVDSGGLTSALLFNGDEAQVRNVSAGNVTTVDGDARGVFWHTEGSTLENVGLLNVSSTNGDATGFDWFLLNDLAGDVNGLTVANVTAGGTATGMMWWHGSGTLANARVGDVTGGTGNAYGFYRLEGLGGTADGVIAGDVETDDANAFGVLWSFTDGGTLRNTTVGDVTVTTDGNAQGLAFFDGGNTTAENLAVGDVTGITGALNRLAVGVRFFQHTNATLTDFQVGDVTSLGESAEFSGGARGIDLFGGSNLQVSDFTVGNVVAAAIAPDESWARGVSLSAIGDSSVRNGTIGNVLAAGTGATAIGVDFQQNGLTAENIQIGTVSGDDPNSIGIRFLNVSGGVANDITFPTIAVNGIGVLLTGATATNHTGTGNAVAINSLGFQPCVDNSGDSTGTNVEFNAASCP